MLAVPGEPETAEEFRENVERNLEIRDRLDDTNGYTEYGCEKDTVENGSGGGLRRVRAQTNSTKYGGNDKDHKVHPFRYLLVLLHEASCKVRIRRQCENFTVVANAQCMS